VLFAVIALATSTTQACAPPDRLTSQGLCVAPSRSAATLPGPGHTAWPVLMLLGVAAVLIAAAYIRFRRRRRHAASA
jgi:LPXTG-motif cell wall-anchored protein